MNEKEFKKKNKQDVCSMCPIRLPCSAANSICELVAPCEICDIKDSCTVLCNQMNSYLSRGNQRVLPSTSFNESPRREDYYSFKDAKQKEPTGISVADIDFRIVDLPWDILSKRDAKIVRGHFLDNTSYEDLAKKYKITTRRVYVIIHGESKKKTGALDRLKKFTVYRIMYNKYGKYLLPKHQETLLEKYFNFRSPEEIKKLDETTGQVYYRIKKAEKLLMKFLEIEE